MWPIRLAQLWSILLTAFLTPLRMFYLRGPGWGTIGFWMGNAPEDICASLTDVTASHWFKHPAACADLIALHDTSSLMSRRWIAFIMNWRAWLEFLSV